MSGVTFGERSLRQVAILVVLSALTSCGDGPTGLDSIDFNDLVPIDTIGSDVEFVRPAGLIVSGGQLWVTDQHGASLQRWTTAGVRTLNITNFGAAETFDFPWGLTAQPGTGNIYVADGFNSVLRVFTAAGAFLTSIDVGLYEVRSVAFSASGSKAYVCAFGDGCFIYTVGGTATLPTFSLTGSFGITGPGTLVAAYQITRDASGNFWVADYEGEKVEVFDGEGAYVRTLAHADLVVPTAVKVLANGVTLVTDEGAAAVLVFDATGARIGSFGEGVLGFPEDVEIIGTKFYVSDWEKRMIIVFQLDPSP